MMFQKAQDKLLNFAKTQDYIKLLKNYAGAVSKILKKSGTVLYICKRDEVFIDVIREAYGKICKVEVSDSIKIGGILAVNKVMSLVVDETLDSKLEEQRNWFEENSKLNIF